MCQEAVWEGIRRGDAEPYSEVGRWWYGEDEIDIVGLAPNDDRILLAECKWTSNPVGDVLVERLRARAANVRWGPGDGDERFALLSKSGFVDGLEAELDTTWTLYSTCLWFFQSFHREKSASQVAHAVVGVIRRPFEEMEENLHP